MLSRIPLADARANQMLRLPTGLVLYVLAGYPLWLRLRAKQKPRPVRKIWFARSVSVLLAVRNGERHLASKLENLIALDYPRDLLEILVSGDGCTDRSEAITREFMAR